MTRAGGFGCGIIHHTSVTQSFAVMFHQVQHVLHVGSNRMTGTGRLKEKEISFKWDYQELDNTGEHSKAVPLLFC